MDREKVIKGLECCSMRNGTCKYAQEPICPYVESCRAKDYSALKRDALELLKEQKEEIENLKQMAQSMMEGICLLKEKEAVEPEWRKGTPFCGNCGHRTWCDECCEAWKPKEETDKNDMVQVVRCKDCKHYHKGFNCDLMQKPIFKDDNWFCADGERRESE